MTADELIGALPDDVASRVLLQEPGLSLLCDARREWLDSFSLVSVDAVTGWYDSVARLEFDRPPSRSLDGTIDACRELHIGLIHVTDGGRSWVQLHPGGGWSGTGPTFALQPYRGWGSRR